MHTGPQTNRERSHSSNSLVLQRPASTVTQTLKLSNGAPAQRFSMRQTRIWLLLRRLARGISIRLFFKTIETEGVLAPFQRLGGRTLIALDGTEHFCSSPCTVQLRPGYLGDDLFACQPIAEAIHQVGGSFILTCKPASHQTVSEYLHGATLEQQRRTEIVRGKRTTTIYRLLRGAVARHR